MVHPANGAVVRLKNRGFGDAQVRAFTLVAESPDLPEGPRGGESPTPDIRAVGTRVDRAAAGVCLKDAPSFVWSFAITTHERQAHLLPVRLVVNLDLDRDGSVDFVVLTLNRGARVVSAVVDYTRKR